VHDLLPADPAPDVDAPARLDSVADVAEVLAALGYEPHTEDYHPTRWTSPTLPVAVVASPTLHNACAVAVIVNHAARVWLYAPISTDLLAAALTEARDHAREASR